MDLTGSKWQQKNGENAVFRRFMEICGSLWMMKWWPGRELNPRHADFQSAALPTELPGLSEERRIKQARGALVNEPSSNQTVRVLKSEVTRASAHSPWASPTPRRRRTSPFP